MRSLNVAIVTCTDTRALADDTAGAALEDLCSQAGWQVRERVIVADDHDAIVAHLGRLADIEGVDVIFTCGGTGFGPRDVTPEATQDACERMAPGIAEAIRSGSMSVTRRAMLSRGTAGIRGRTLVINLPGSRKAAVESFGFVGDQLEHAIEMIEGGGH